MMGRGRGLVASDWECFSPQALVSSPIRRGWTRSSLRFLPVPTICSSSSFRVTKASLDFFFLPDSNFSGFSFTIVLRSSWPLLAWKWPLFFSKHSCKKYTSAGPLLQCEAVVSLLLIAVRFEEITWPLFFHPQNSTMISTPKGLFGENKWSYTWRTSRVPISFSCFLFSKAKRIISPFFSLQQPSPTTLGKPTPALPLRPLRQVCPQANVTRNTRIVCCVSFGSCVPWWLKILATTRKPRSSRTSFRKAQQEVGLEHPGWASLESSESWPAL